MENNIKTKKRIAFFLNFFFIISICISIFTLGYIIYLNITYPHFDEISIIIQKNEAVTAAHLLFGFKCYHKTTFERLNFVESNNGDMKASCAPRTNHLGELHYFFSSNDLEICAAIIFFTVLLMCVLGISRDIIKDKIKEMEEPNSKKIN